VTEAGFQEVLDIRGGGQDCRTKRKRRIRTGRHEGTGSFIMEQKNPDSGRRPADMGDMRESNVH
jgi:hypothetical protein